MEKGKNLGFKAIYLGHFLHLGSFLLVLHLALSILMQLLKLA